MQLLTGPYVKVQGLRTEPHRNRLSVTGRGNTLYCHVKLPDCLGTQPVSPVRIGNPFAAPKATGADSNNSCPSSDEVKSAHNYCPTRMHGNVLMLRIRTVLERYNCPCTRYGETGRLVVQLHSILNLGTRLR